MPVGNRCVERGAFQRAQRAMATAGRTTARTTAQTPDPMAAPVYARAGEGCQLEEELQDEVGHSHDLSMAAVLREHGQRRQCPGEAPSNEPMARNAPRTGVVSTTDRCPVGAWFSSLTT